LGSREKTSWKKGGDLVTLESGGKAEQKDDEREESERN